MFELEDPVGKQFADGTIIGVVSDFSYHSVHHSIGPLVLAYYPGWSRQISIRLSGGNIPEAIRRIETVWNSFAPGFPFRYQFLDDAIGRLYAKEERLFRLFMYFSILAIFVACLGLSGLALFATQQRTKEVGIRKVFGSSVKNIVLCLQAIFCAGCCWPTYHRLATYLAADEPLARKFCLSHQHTVVDVYHYLSGGFSRED
jgi:putative ABC transport system permease protein